MWFVFQKNESDISKSMPISTVLFIFFRNAKHDFSFTQNAIFFVLKTTQFLLRYKKKKVFYLKSFLLAWKQNIDDSLFD